jgi:DNA-binding NarL/FixJ family response regulator
MDIRMPGTDGLEATRRISRAVPGAAVLVLTMYDDDDTVFAAMRAGPGLPAQGRRAGRDRPRRAGHRRR